MHEISRRAMLKSAGAGFGYLALAALSAEHCAAGQARRPAPGGDPLAPRPGHHQARGKRIIFLFMHGGPSQVDTFDYKPRLQRDHGKDLPFAPSQGVGAL